jgi:hypothetical protein
MGSDRDEPRADEYPPEWIEDAKRLGVDPLVWAGTTAGAIHLAVWRKFPDAAPYEYDLAMAHIRGLKWGPMGRGAVERVRAVREARGQAPDIPDDRWDQLARYVWPHLTEAQRVSAPAILAAVRAIAPERHSQEPEAHGFKEIEIRRAAEAVRSRKDAAPTRAEVAAELHTSESTLRRSTKKLRMTSWPPAAPED